MFHLQSEPVDIEALKLSLKDERAGAYAAFEGWVRNHNEGESVDRLEYEAFEALALSEGEKIIAEAREKFNVHQVRCVHRVGTLALGECAVWVGVATSHRGDAFAACRYIIDEIKHRLPIWKKEFYTNGNAVWVNCQGCADHVVQTKWEQSDFYARQMILPTVGDAGQEKLLRARVLVVGAGGLGSAALQYLAAAGVGTIGICEFDELHLSNLHRQTLYTASEIGQSKAKLAQSRLSLMNPLIQVICHTFPLEATSAEALFAEYDWVLDCTDNFRTKYLMNDTAVLTQTPLIQASIYQYEGQLQLYSPQFNTACLRCLWPEIPAEGSVGSCAEVGVLGVVPGIFGVLQATECIKFILGLTSPLGNHLLLFDLLSYQTRLIQRQKNPQCPVCSTVAEIRSVDPENYQDRWCLSYGEFTRKNAPAFRLVDIRERIEVEADPAPFACQTLPASSTDCSIYIASRDVPTLYCCQSGKRSIALVQTLREKGVENAYSLREGFRSLNAFPAQLQPIEASV